jgi:hypothetical protein
MARKLMSAPRLDDATGDRTNHLGDQLGYVRRRPCLSKQSQGDRRGVDHTDPPAPQPAVRGSLPSNE